MYQFATYYRTKFNDRPIISASVTNYDNPAALAGSPYTFTPIGTALAALVTQLYLDYRVDWGLGTMKAASSTSPSSQSPTLTKSEKLAKKLSNLTFCQIGCKVQISANLAGSSEIDPDKRATPKNLRQFLFDGYSSQSTYVRHSYWSHIYKRFSTLLDTLLTREELKAQMVGTYGMDPVHLQSCPIGTETTQGAMVQSTGIHLQAHTPVHETCDRPSFAADDKAGAPAF
ncbi:hypothetical protein BS17DRAFT_767463 [Gyrodon lividus]|nr:hypothetical protein BS17DRAFT_767463 [Gyrodon lividus]